ncbi:Ig-like domain-containing protein [Vibrio cholerae]|uniref:Ig-like domain-containing protein n=1 Tax=Vibrio cholerae TaxID=666 RepID=UPI002FDBCDF4
MNPLDQQKAKQDGVFSKALREASNAFVQMGGHPRTLLHHTRRNDLIEQVIAKLHILKREGDAYHQLGQPAVKATSESSQEKTLEDDSALEHVGFVKVDDAPVSYATLVFSDDNEGKFSLGINNPYEQIVKYSSSDESVATVDEKTGVITPVDNGEVTIHVAFTKKGEHPRVEDSFDLVIEDEQASSEETQQDNQEPTGAEASAQ